MSAPGGLGDELRHLGSDRIRHCLKVNQQEQCRDYNSTTAGAHKPNWKVKASNTSEMSMYSSLIHFGKPHKKMQSREVAEVSE